MTQTTDRSGSTAPPRRGRDPQAATFTRRDKHQFIPFPPRRQGRRACGLGRASRADRYDPPAIRAPSPAAIARPIRAAGTPADAKAASQIRPDSEAPRRRAGRRRSAGSYRRSTRSRRCRPPRGRAAEMLPVGSPAARNVAPHERARAVDQRNRTGLDFERAAACRGHLGRMADQPEPGDVRARVHDRRRRFSRTSAAARFSVVIDRTAASMAASGARPNFSAVAMTPVPIDLVSNSASPGTAPAIRQHARRIDLAGDRVAELDLRVLDRVSAEQRHAGLGQLVETAREDAAAGWRGRRLSETRRSPAR